jgi:MFS family permease
MIIVSLLGGAILDRRDRRPVLAVAQIGIITAVGALAVLAISSSHPPVVAILILGGLLAGCTALDGVCRSAIIPGTLGKERLRHGLALNYGLFQATSVIGPGLGGVMIAVFSVSGAYVIDAVSCLGPLIAAFLIAPQHPVGLEVGESHPPIGSQIAEGLRFVGSTKALAGSFVIDLNAMAFGMPRALFAVLSLSVYHSGAIGTGALYAAIAAGGTISVLTSGWVTEARRIGRIVIGCVALWGLAILAAGLTRSIYVAVLLLAVAGWADGISAVCRSTISQLLTPDRMRGRMGAVFSLVVTSGPRLGDIESGLVAGAVGALNSVLIGGAACIVGVGATMLAFPALAAFDADRHTADLAD